MGRGIERRGWLVAVAGLWAAAASSFGHDEDPRTLKKIEEFRRLHAIERDATPTPPLRDGIGRVSFPCMVRTSTARAYIEQGVAELHGDSPRAAERSFRAAIRSDPMCAIGYWGMALASLDDEPRALAFIELASYLKGYRRLVSTRESRYIEALNAYLQAGPGRDRERRKAYVKALEEIVVENPDDCDARAWLARQLVSNQGAGIPMGSLVAADALLRQVVAALPAHPARWYRMLLWENERPSAALDAAQECGPATPELAAAWSAAGRLFERLGQVEEAARAHEAAIRVHCEHARRELDLPDAEDGFAESVAAVVRLRARSGRVGEALDEARALADLPRHPRINHLGRPGSSVVVGRRLVREVLARYELWDELEVFERGTVTGPAGNVEEAAWHARSLGRVAFARGDVAGGRRQIEGLRVLEMSAPVQDSGRATRGVQRAGGPDASPSLTSALAELEGREAIATGRSDDGLGRLGAAADLDAVDLARVQVQAGRLEDAHNRLAEEARARSREVLPLALLVEVRWALGLRQEAEQAFAELREAAAGAELTLPPLARLAGIARALGYPEDWRAPRMPRIDTADRARLDALGPPRWSPPEAPAWRLNDARGEARSLAEFRGRPVVLLFYLGAGCLHCVQQLEAFGAMARRFDDAGIKLLAIGTDGPEVLKKAWAQGEEPFPFPVASDVAFDAFRAYRLFDAGMLTPLHAAFLIDSKGRILWCDRGTDPFQDAEFLLGEGRRLQALDVDRRPAERSRRGP
jgi:peroxiredoxin